jgi:hypothetical protein
MITPENVIAVPIGNVDSWLGIAVSGKRELCASPKILIVYAIDLLTIINILLNINLRSNR